MTCIELHDTGQNSEKQRFGYPWLSKTFQTHPLKSVEAEPCFRKVSLPLQNYICFPAHLRVREFWPQIYSHWQALEWGLLYKILASLECQKVDFLEYLCQGTLGCHSLSTCIRCVTKTCSTQNSWIVWTDRYVLANNQLYYSMYRTHQW